jgi:Domain of unknown function (DUF6379)
MPASTAVNTLGEQQESEGAAMFEKYMILTQEFRNVKDANNVTGFQVKVRLPYYRGVWLSTVHHLELKVDDENFSRDKMTLSVAGRTFTMDELENATTVRWFFGDPATLIIRKPGGLSVGMHTVYYAVGWRHSYLPTNDPEHVFYDPQGITGFPPGAEAMIDSPTATSKRMTLVV